ncbi:MAG: AraC family transcriptional regulator [Rhodobacteraceae bacterium]|nr:AraC family transcriptional regulator [Paracoccaceae bacterium]
MLEEALVLDANGAPIRHQGRTHSRDWDEVQEFCRTVYMPYRVQPLERFSRPDATMLSAKAGQVTMTRFSYGAGIYLDKFDPAAGNILVLNTLRGALEHHCDASPATTRAGESFVVDCSRTDYWLEGDADHMQFNLTIPHQVMEDIAERWFGFVPDDSLWTRRVKFGGPESRWLLLLEYAARTLCTETPLSANGALGKHIEEMICLELLQHWAAGAGVSLERGARAAAPHYVRRAEEIMSAEAREAPTIGQVAQRVGVSARTLSEGFRRFRGITPRSFLAARRLDGLKADLETAPSERSISGIAADWGYVNAGALAGAYRRRFGELPSHTRSRAARSR